uniref:SAM domain-containing protein n=1 Tax=Leptobrachium leishanense TaxID=445787 RepID=A0A8C5QVL5_9ANUR
MDAALFIRPWGSLCVFLRTERFSGWGCLYKNWVVPAACVSALSRSVENGRPPDPALWAVDDVFDYLKCVGFEEQASAFKDQEIDGKSLLLMTRSDVLTGLSLKLGPALKIYEYHVKPLQTQHIKKSSC